MARARSSLRAGRGALAALAVATFALAATPAAQAALQVEHSATTATPSSGSGFIGPGDTFSILEEIHNNELALSSIQRPIVRP